jgi:hypothetical protein
MTREEVISNQLEAYNSHDLEAFCACYSDHIELRNMCEAEPFLRTKVSLRDLYGKKFANPALKARIANRMVKGDFVIDNEKVTGVGDGELDVIVIYELEGDLIKRVLFIR